MRLARKATAGVAVLVGLLAVLVPSGPAAAATPKATGDAAAIALYRKVVAATSATSGVEEIFTAAAPLTQARYSSAGLSWYIMQPKKAGFAAADDVVFIAAAGGKVRFVTDSVVYGGTGKAPFPPFGLVLTAKGEVLLDGAAPALAAPPLPTTPIEACATPLKPPHFVAGYPQVGVAYGYSLYGHFDPLKQAAKDYDVTSTFPWSSKPSRTATELDVVQASTDLPVESIVHVSAGGQYPAFTLRWVNVWFKKALYPPKTNGACAAYLKGA